MKRLEKTAKIEGLLRASFGADADISSLVVFEFVAANLNALRKRGGIYEGARFTQNTLAEMATLPGKESIQLILNHSDGMMPVGRVFAGEVKDESLHVLVAISGATEAKLVSDIETGIIDQVSVGVIPSRLLCSECGFDYMSEEANFDNWWDLTCNEGHQIGQDGVHVRIAGAQTWYELSLVGMGAVPGARSVPKDQSAFAENSMLQRLAASGVPQTRLVCSNHIHQTPKEPDNMTDLTALTAQIATTVADKTKLEMQLTAMTGERDGLKAKMTEAEAALTAANTRISELEAAAKDAPSKEGWDLMLSAMKDLAKKTKIALGVAEPTLSDDPAELIASFKADQEKLTAAIPVGPTGKAVDSDKNPKGSPAMAAFAVN